MILINIDVRVTDPNPAHDYHAVQEISVGLSGVRVDSSLVRV